MFQTDEGSQTLRNNHLSHPNPGYTEPNDDSDANGMTSRDAQRDVGETQYSTGDVATDNKARQAEDKKPRQAQKVGSISWWFCRSAKFLDYNDSFNARFGFFLAVKR